VNSKKSRYTFGVFTDNIILTYQSTIWKGISIAAEERDINLLTFVGSPISSPFHYHAKRNSVYKLLNTHVVDGLIVFSGTIGSYVSHERFMDFLRCYSDIPLVSIGKEITGIPSIIVENERGMEDLLVHLIEKHKARNIAFIKGPEGNNDAQTRFSIYKSVLARYSIPYNDDLVTEGSFYHGSGDQAVQSLVFNRNQNLDAIVAANDVMAIDTITTLVKNGMKVPGDIMVTGFDDIVLSQVSTPSVTTVKQPIFDLGYKGVETLFRVLKGEAVPGVLTLHSSLQVRESCGCIENKHRKAFLPCENEPGAGLENIGPGTIPEGVAEQMYTHISILAKNNVSLEKLSGWIASLMEKIQKPLEELEYLIHLKEIITESAGLGIRISLWGQAIAEMIQGSLLHTSDPCKREALYQVWISSLSVLNSCIVKECKLSRLMSEEQREQLHTISQNMDINFNEDRLKGIIKLAILNLHIPGIFLAFYSPGKIESKNYARLEYAYDKNGQVIPGLLDREFSTRDLVPGGLALTSPSSYIIFPLYFRDEEFGFVVYKKGSGDGFIYSNLTSQFSFVIKGSRLVGQVRNHSRNLETEVAERTADLEHANVKLKKEIEERVKTEGELFKEKEKALVTLNSIGDGVITTDISGRITYINPMAEKLLGMKSSEVINTELKRVYILRDENKNEIKKDILGAVLKTESLIQDQVPSYLQSRDNKEYIITQIAAPLKNNENEIIGIVLVLQNISESHRMSQQLSFYSSHDHLTGLYNRKRFKELIKENILTIAEKGLFHVLCHLNIDNFKIVNDAGGQIAGDEAIQSLGLLIQETIRNTDIIARTGGDEFGILLVSCSMEAGKKIMEKLLRKIDRNIFTLNNKIFHLTVSVGFVYLDSYTMDITHILSASNLACILAKKRGGNQIHVYEPDDNEFISYQNEIQFLPQITKALEEKRFTLYYQEIRPINPTLSGEKHFEILIRMLDTDGGIIPPNRFIPAAERYNKMIYIDRYVIERVFSYCYSKLHDENESGCMLSTYFNVNISLSTLLDKDFSVFIKDIISRYPVPVSMICFEITETAALHNFSLALQLFSELRELGFHFALDDFGSGWATFNYLKFFPVDYLKIDGSFVKGIASNNLDMVMVDTMNQIGHAMGLKTVAEYVENKEIMDKLISLGVDFGQGYYISRPAPLDTLSHS
jgi:diguanylate cyclase (GGDEF)-like protein/PAS domain S-box-containing protein